MKKYTLDSINQKDLCLSFKGVKREVSILGFEPLDCKIKRFLLSGEMAQFTKNMFDTHDYEEMYSVIPDVSYEMDDDIEETREKIQLLMKKRSEIMARKLAALKEREKTGETVVSPGVETKADTPDVKED